MGLHPVDPTLKPGEGGQWRVTQDYVMGLAFNTARDRVVLIRKTKPAHLNGKWNGIGGKLEMVENEYTIPGLREFELEPEDPQTAMAREFKEETGVETTPEQWDYFGSLQGPWGCVYLYRTFDDNAVANAKTMEEEIVNTFHITDLPTTCLTNTRYLIQAALDPSKPKIDLYYET